MFERFYREHVHRVQHFVAGRATDAGEVADLTARIFLAAIKLAHTYRTSEDPVTWLYGVARNVAATSGSRGEAEIRAHHLPVSDRPEPGSDNEEDELAAFARAAANEVIDDGRRPMDAQPLAGRRTLPAFEHRLLGELRWIVQQRSTTHNRDADG